MNDGPWQLALWKLSSQYKVAVKSNADCAVSKSIRSYWYWPWAVHDNRNHCSALLKAQMCDMFSPCVAQLIITGGDALRTALGCEIVAARGRMVRITAVANVPQVDTGGEGATSEMWTGCFVKLPVASMCPADAKLSAAEGRFCPHVDVVSGWTVGRRHWRPSMRVAESTGVWSKSVCVGRCTDACSRAE